MSAADEIRALREAVRVSPDNVPLRTHLAGVLARAGFYEEAELEYRAALSRAPNDVSLQLALAQTFWAQGKAVEAALIVDGLIEHGSPLPAASLLAARLALRDGRRDDAIAHYRHALQGDATLADDALANELGLGALEEAAEIVEGKMRVAEGGGGILNIPLERPTITFKDVGGMEHVKEAILRIHVKGKPQDALDLESVARKAEHFSGADLKGLVDVAVERKLQEALKVGTPKPLTTKDLLAAAAQVKPSTREWFATAKNYVLYANEGGVYDDVAKYLRL